MKRVLFIFLPLLAAWLLSFCGGGAKSSVEKSPYLNVRDSVGYVGMQACMSCHANVHETFIHTGMGRSFDLASPQKSAATYGSHAVVYDTLRDFYYHPFFKDSTLYVLEYRIENGDTVHRRLEKISHVIGSGQHTNSHLLDVNGYIFQAPVTFYTQEKRWDMAPGFRADNIRFDRWLGAECLTCHNHYPTLVPGSLHKYADMPRGIECERCHGPGKLHVEEMKKGNVVDIATQTDFTIVNPRKLPRDLQMDLCQRCHLQGIAVLEDGKTFYDFKPGMRLTEVMNVFLPRYAESDERFIMASQADRLRLSKCFKQSKDLSCLTCHQPHRSVEVTSLSQYNDACMGCHTSAKHTTCTAPADERASQSDNCVHCHMPRSGSIDIPHVRITDHLISKKAKGKRQKEGERSGFLGLEILTKDNPSPLDMAKGYLAAYEKYIGSPALLDSVEMFLNQSKAEQEKKLPLVIHLHYLQGNYDGILKNLPGGAAPDVWTAYRIGEAFFQKGDHWQALDWFSQAAAALPYHLEFQEKKGMTEIALKRVEAGKKTLEWVLTENPKRPVALCNLGFAYALSGNLERAEQLYNQALALDPDYEQALLNKAALLVFLKRNGEAKRMLVRVLKINPENGQAKSALAKL